MIALLAALWAGALIGVSLLATPIKFRARTLPYHAALEVGRLTFQALAWLEVSLLGTLLLAHGLAPGPSPPWFVWSLAIVAGVLVGQRWWLLPRMRARVDAVLEHRTRPPPSRLHHAFIAAEVVKLAALIAIAARGRS